jgi:hypothetical protein
MGPTGYAAPLRSAGLTELSKKNTIRENRHIGEFEVSLVLLR